MELDRCSKIDDYLSGALSPEAQGAFALHIASCSKCRECELHSQAMQETLFAENESIIMRPQFETQLLAALHCFESQQKSNWIDWRISASIGAAILAASILWAIFVVPNRSVGVAVRAPNSIDSKHSQNHPSPPKEELGTQPPSVSAGPGYLCAQVESDVPDIEFYVVRPVTQRN